MKKKLLILAGSFFVALGFVGIFIPLLPTTPFLLLATACYIRSSPKLYQWITKNRIFGVYIRNYYEKKGIPLSIKLFSLSLMWGSILLTFYYMEPFLWQTIALIIIALLVSIHVMLIKSK
jgi:uncharacterized protein